MRYLSEEINEYQKIMQEKNIIITNSVFNDRILSVNLVSENFDYFIDRDINEDLDYICRVNHYILKRVIKEELNNNNIFFDVINFILEDKYYFNFVISGIKAKYKRYRKFSYEKIRNLISEIKSDISVSLDYIIRYYFMNNSNVDVIYYILDIDCIKCATYEEFLNIISAIVILKYYDIIIDGIVEKLDYSLYKF